MNTRVRRAGFTIVELLIVIVVIGILAAIALATYTGVQERAAASSLVDTLKKTEKAFKAMAVDTGTTTWWNDNSFTGAETPELYTLTALRKYINTDELPSPSIAGVGVGWAYDNDGNTYNGCAANTNGVNLYINNVSNTRVITQIESMMDDGNTSCGRVRHVNGAIVYSVATSQSTGL
ncbi:prepilin-type N-terminal cleavage/methylation domain-containing protein [Candidatus Saccharibacteria bacterium]|nr:prepilin-type N-terminal cleavage/methylation domain-containing protein [Candidatus Saccharibacteria bacterium]